MKIESRGKITVQQDDDFDAQKQKGDPLLGLMPYSLAEFIQKESVLIALATVICYYLTYVFYSSYLSYFGVFEIFVDFNLSKVIVSAVGVFFLSISIYQITSVLPLQALGKFLEAAFVFPHLFFPMSFLIVSIWISGYSYTSQFLVVYLLITGPWTAIWLRRKLQSGTPWREIFQKSVDEERKVRPHFLGSAIADSRFGGVFLMVALLICAANLLGNWAGNRAAFRERDFMLLEYRDMELAIVGTYNDQFIGVAIERVDERASLTGSILLIPPPSSGDKLLMQNTRMHVKEIEHPKQSSIEWVSFEDAWRRNSARIRGWISVQD